MEKGLAMKKFVAVTLVLLAPALLLCAAEGDKHEGPQKAIAVLHAASNSQVHGWVTFTQKDGYVEIKGEVMGLTPGKHGFHIHEFGDFSSPDAMSTGGHFNPAHKQHGGPDDENRHAGDFGNITADADGKATIEARDKGLALGGHDSIIGRAVIVHAKADDLKTQPSGDAGARIACGIIGVANPNPPKPK
jgi:Cu-Zn family superoxide dismutase